MVIMLDVEPAIFSFVFNLFETPFCMVLAALWKWNLPCPHVEVNNVSFAWYFNRFEGGIIQLAQLQDLHQELLNGTCNFQVKVARLLWCC